MREVEAKYGSLMSFATYLEWVIGKVETRGAASTLSITYFAQLALRGSNPDLYQTSAVSNEFNTE